MSGPVLYALPGGEAMADALVGRVAGAVRGGVEIRRFPDGEAYVRLVDEPAGRVAVIVGSLDHPDDKLVPLLLLAETARELGAPTVALVAPYLGYLRQDRRFQAGEAVSARIFPRVLGRFVDALVTVDPHLHRIHALGEVYPIPTRVVHAAPVVAAWIAREVERPLLVGPDEESAQWVADVAARAGAPFLVLTKLRRGDRDVEVSVPDVERWRGRTPVLVDDIVSTGRTMAETVGHLRRAGLAPPVCVAVHALFAPGAAEALQVAGAGRVVSCDAVLHPTNAVGLGALLAPALADVLAALPAAAAPGARSRLPAD